MHECRTHLEVEVGRSADELLERLSDVGIASDDATVEDVLSKAVPARFVRIGVPAVQLDQQGRARKEMADLYRWRYDALGDLPAINAERRFQLGVPGFAHTFQLVDVEDPQGVGESVPHPHYIQNLSEAEFVVATFMYMRLRGIPASKISIITTYNGQKDLIGDVVAQRYALAQCHRPQA